MIMVDWVPIFIFGFGAPTAIVFLFWLVAAVTDKKWPFNKKQKKINSGAKFG